MFAEVEAVCVPGTQTVRGSTWHGGLMKLERPQEGLLSLSQEPWVGDVIFRVSGRE